MNKSRINKTKLLTQTAIIAAIYACLSFAMFFISFGAVQYRVSEALTVLPMFTSTAIPGLTLGCALSNLIAYFLGVNPAGLIDAVVGSGATLIAAIISFYLGKVAKKGMRYFLVPLPPVIINAVVIGLEISIVFMGTTDIKIVLLNCVSVFVGQLVVCYGLGIPLIKILEKNDVYKKIFRVN